ncbi:MAG: HEAT repeat domain-containing protein [Planctomycetes bacterium]|nr:HEAT repeat domain-containing protein [Planctomycetota bacterium]
MHPKYAAQLVQAGPAATAASDPRAESARAFLGLFLKSARAAQLYPRHSKIRQDMVHDFATSLESHLATHGETLLDVRQFAIRSFGEDVYFDENRQRSLAFRLFVNGVRGISFRPGLTKAEAEGVVDVLTIAFRPDASGEEIQTSVWERCFEHAAFEINDDVFTSGESEEFEGFIQECDALPQSARGARAAEEPVWLDLEELVPVETSDAPVAQPSADDLTHVAASLDAEMRRDLCAEMADFLTEALEDGGAEAVHGPLEEFVEHLLAAGDVLRAARLVAHLRKLSQTSRDPATGRALTDVIERIGRSKIVPGLAPLASSLCSEDLDGFTMLLVAIGEPAIAPLVQLLATEAHDHALHALRTLAARHPRALAPFVQDTRPEVVRAVVSLLAASATKETVGALLPALHHADAAVRRDALKSVVAIGGGGITDLLLGVLDDPVYELRALALDAIGALRDPKAVTPLLLRAESPKFGSASAYEKRETYRALGRIGTTEATAWLAKILSSTSFFRREHQDEVRCLAAAALALATNSGARAVLTHHANDKSDAVKRAVQQALREHEKRAATGPSGAARPASGSATIPTAR